MKDEGNWDPKPSERTYYRSASTGDLGFLVKRNGQDMIRLDRPRDEVVRSFKSSEWIPEHERRPMTRAQLAQVAFAADTKLCLFLGLHIQAKRKWLDLDESERISWIGQGPTLKAHAARRSLYTLIMEGLGSLTS